MRKMGNRGIRKMEDLGIKKRKDSWFYFLFQYVRTYIRVKTSKIASHLLLPLRRLFRRLRPFTSHIPDPPVHRRVSISCIHRRRLLWTWLL